MTRVGEFYGEATDTKLMQKKVDGHSIEIRYNYWERQDEECVTQRWTLPSLEQGHYSLMDWLLGKAAECKALMEEGFVAIECHDNAVIWSRQARQ